MSSDDDDAGQQDASRVQPMGYGLMHHVRFAKPFKNSLMEMANQSKET